MRQDEICNEFSLHGIVLTHGPGNTKAALEIVHLNDFLGDAFKRAPEHPRALMHFVECRILYGKGSAFEFIPSIRRNLESAIETSLHRVRAGMHIPHAWYDIGFFELLLGKNHESLADYAKAVRATSSAAQLQSVYATLTEMQKKAMEKKADLAEGLAWVRFFLKALLVGRFHALSPDSLCSSNEPHHGLSTPTPWARDNAPTPFSSGDNIVIVAGSCSHGSEEILSEYEPFIHKAFADFRGTICCGGTVDGVSGIIGRLENNDGRIRKLGYLPRDKQPMAAYECIETAPGPFSPLETLTLWRDLLLSGIAPTSVRVLGVRGGKISAFEYQLALLLGAKVGVLPESGGASRQVADDPEWSRPGTAVGCREMVRLLRLPTDVETLRSFIRPSRPPEMIDPDSREKMAVDIHEGYSRNAGSNHASTLPLNIAPWEQLDESFKKATLRLIDHVEDKLRRVGLALRKVEKGKPDPYTFSREQVHILAEMEHGRWVVERLEDGWTLGEHDDQRKTRPQLIPWSGLPDSEKEKDYASVERLPEILLRAGYEIFSPDAA